MTKAYPYEVHEYDVVVVGAGLTGIELAAELGVIEAAGQHRGVGADADERVADFVSNRGGEAPDRVVVRDAPGSWRLARSRAGHSDRRRFALGGLGPRARQTLERAGRGRAESEPLEAEVAGRNRFVVGRDRRAAGCSGGLQGRSA